MRPLLALLLTAASTAASAIAYNPIPPMSPMYETFQPVTIDYFYTMDVHNAYISLSEGYGNQNTAFHLERFAQATTKPFKRFWKGPPQTDHFYTEDPTEVDFVLANGWIYEGVEGHIYVVQVPGSVALHRLNKFNGNTGDLAHKYTTSEVTVAQMLAQGWYYDRIAGYVPTTTVGGNSVDGYPHIDDGLVMTRRCGDLAGCAQLPNFRDYYNGYRFVQSTPRPAGSSRQVMTFDLWSPDFFESSQYEHIAIGLHGNWPIDLGDIGNTSPQRQHYALGIIFGGTPCGFDSVDVEAFWPIGNATAHNCGTANTQGRLANNTHYQFRIEVTDSGFVTYDVRREGAPTAIISGTVNGNKIGFTPTYPFPASETGYFIIPATMATEDYTLYFSNLNVAWYP